MLINVAISESRNVIKNEKILKYKYNKHTANPEYKNKSDASKKNGNWNYLKIIHTIRKQHNGLARNEGTTDSQSY
jgi:hypothetical protein